MSDLSKIYGKSFFDDQFGGSLASARIYLSSLKQIWAPSSVIDIGCGRGAWLTAWHEIGVKRLVGIDGEWASEGGLPDVGIEFHPKNLNAPIVFDETFDVAMSLEVAEHLEPKSSDAFVKSLTGLSGAIVFSAAFTGQPGSNHINTRPHSFWAKKFIASGYQLFDYFRPKFWSDEGVEAWYRQNTFLYVKPGHPLHSAMTAKGELPQPDARFVDCLHPYFYLAALDEIGRLQQGPSHGFDHQLPGKAASVGRNAPCPCGSGKKHKHCHGRSA